LDEWQRKVFIELVRQYKRENKMPIAFHDIALQFDFYNGEGIFADMGDPRLKAVIKDKLYQREYARERARRLKKGA
jgi:hypothetical protein